MSKILEIKLKSKLKNMKKKEIKSFLINCIHKHKPNLLINSEYTNELDSDNDNDNYDDKMCQLCKNDVFEKTKYEEICQKCGLVRPIQATGKNYEKIPEYITLGKNIVKITDGGKNFSVDLNKLNTWIQDKDPLYIHIKLIQSTIDELGLINSDEIKQTTIGLFYNLIELFNKNTIFSNLKYNPLNNKKGFIGLCIHYSGLINSTNIKLSIISEKLKINITEIIQANELFQKLFKNTTFSHLKLNEIIKCNTKLNNNNQIIFDKIKNDLITSKIDIKNDESIIYYISKNINKKLKFTLTELSNNCNVSTATITNEKNKINAFYLNNNDLYNKLF